MTFYNYLTETDFLQIGLLTFFTTSVSFIPILLLLFGRKMSTSFPLTKAFRNILVVVKQTPYEQYLQLKAQGKAPVALRWERLKNRYTVHRQCVDDVTAVLGQIGIKYSVVGREELHRGIIQDKDLLIAVGGDGTVLNTSSFVDDSIPILGINSDPTRPEEEGVTKLKDERRSKGALCAASATNLKDYLPRALYGQIPTTYRSRIQTLVRSTTTGILDIVKLNRYG